MESESPPPRPFNRPEPQKATPAELAAAVSDTQDKELDLALEEAMQGFSESDIAGANVPAPSAQEPSVNDVLNGRVANIGTEDILLDFDGKHRSPNRNQSR